MTEWYKKINADEKKKIRLKELMQRKKLYDEVESESQTTLE